MSLLRVAGLRKKYKSRTVVHDVGFEVGSGEVVGLLGPNGAGKTTIFYMITGLIAADSGAIMLDGHDISSLGVSARTRAGLGRAFQLTNLFPNLSVFENVRLAVQATRRGKHRRGLNLWSIWSDHGALVQRTDEILATVAMQDKQDAVVASLPHGDQRKLEVALLIALESRVFMFDEPTAGMSVDEAPVILNLIRSLKNDPTKTILLVEHKMDVVRELADRIIVLTNGTLVADGEPAEVIASPVVQQAYLGVSADDEVPA